MHKRDEALACIDQHKRLLAPVRRLPVELLAAIFGFCLTLPSSQQRETFDLDFSFLKIHEKDHYSSLSCRQAPLLLGRVCSLWRAVALLTPSLWSSFSLQCDDDASTNRAVFGAKTFISRSGMSPLFLSFSLRGGGAGARARQMIDAITPYSQRWRSIEITTIAARRFEMIRALSRVKRSLPVLRTLTIGSSRFDDHALDYKDIFKVAPSLRNVLLFVSLSPWQLRLPWSQLTSFIWNGGTSRMQDYIDIFRFCPNLTFCAFLFIPHSSNSPPPLLSITDDSHVTHLNLCSLHIPSATDLTGFFGWLTLPALRSLRVGGPDQSCWEPAPFTSLLVRSSCILSIAVLELKSAHTLITCLETMPSLNELEIVTPLNYIAFVRVMQRLSYDFPGASRLCRNLRAISLPPANNSSSIDLPALFAFLKSRRKLQPHVALLESIWIVCSSIPDIDLLVGLKRFQDEGLQVSFNDTHGVSWFSKMVKVL
jgi:hypothetical protein